MDGRSIGERPITPTHRPLECVLASLLRSRWTLATALVALALCGVFGWRHFYGADAGAAGRNKANSAQTSAPIPVTIAQAKTADFPVYLNGLGAVEPYQTVLIRSRVDGAIVKIAFKQGQMVKQGDVIAQVDPRPYQATLDQALAKKTQDEASLRDAQLNLQRYAGLAKQDSVSLQQLDTQQATVDQLIAQIKGDQAIIDNAQTQVDYTSIRSPLSGKTGFRLVDGGNIVHAADTTGIVTIVQLQPISVVFTAPEEEVPQINKALAAGVAPVTALSSDGVKTLSQGHLSVVNATIDPASGAIGMKATFENADSALWPGLSVSTRLLVDTLKQVTVVPDGAVERGPNGLYAFVVGGDNKVTMRAITVGEEGNGQSVVLTGLTAGETVVTAGQYRLVQGSVVQSSTASSAVTPAGATPSANSATPPAIAAPSATAKAP
jgi:multidrug efflux system membrane fusion protein